MAIITSNQSKQQFAASWILNKYAGILRTKTFENSGKPNGKLSWMTWCLYISTITQDPWVNHQDDTIHIHVWVQDSQPKRLHVPGAGSQHPGGPGDPNEGMTNKGVTSHLQGLIRRHPNLHSSDNVINTY